jgi:uncharacterized protein with HEPN domain
MSRVKELFLFDMLVAIAKIKNTCQNFEHGDQLKHDYMAWDSVIREFEILGEATKNLIDSEIFDNSKREIVNFRNVLVHEYFGIDEEEVFDIAQNRLDELKIIVVSKINQIDDTLKLELIEDFIDENSYLDFVVKVLKELKDEK